MAKTTTLSVKARAAFLQGLRETCNVTLAAETAGVARSRAYALRRRDRDFAAAWDDALEEGVDRLEAEVHRRAFAGVDKPVVYQGRIATVADKKTGTERPVTIKDYSDTLAMFLLRAHRPEKYRERNAIEPRGTVVFEIHTGRPPPRD